MKTTVVIPTYNEAENLRAMATGAPETYLFQTLICLIVDDESPDGTGALADELSREFAPRFHVMHRPAKSGSGTAYIRWLSSWAMQQRRGLYRADGRGFFPLARIFACISGKD